MTIIRWSVVLGLVCMCVPAFGGTTTISFSCNTGLLTNKVGGSGVLAPVNGRGAFSGSNATLLAQGGSPVYSASAVTISMMLQPNVDAVNGVGLIITQGGADDPLTATVAANGDVMLSGYMGEYVTEHFTYPAAYNNVLTLTYDPSSDIATIFLNGSHSVSLNGALMGSGAVQAGVFSNGPGGFANFTASGASIPTYSSPVFGLVSSPGVGLKELYQSLLLQVQVTAASTDVSYQWLKDGVPLSGETGATYSVASLLPGNAGSYVCRVTDGCGVVHYTAPAVVTLLPEGSLPVGGTSGLCALAGLMGAAAMLVLRRRTA